MLRMYLPGYSNNTVIEKKRSLQQSQGISTVGYISDDSNKENRK